MAPAARSAGPLPDDQPPDTAAFEAEMQVIYPQTSHTRKWTEALRACRAIVERGEATYAELLEFARQYRAFVDAGGVSGPDKVTTPQSFFCGADRIWKQYRPLPKSKAQTQQDATIDAGQEFLREMQT